MSDSLFISDLHLSAKQPGIVGRFLRFLDEVAARADRLYILGDLFDAWIGDDDRTPPIPEILAAMRCLSDSGAKIHLMHGNRDFFIGEEFCSLTGCTILPDPSVIDLGGKTTLLMHGDLLCTDDIEYLKARLFIRSDQFRSDFFAKTLGERAFIAAEYRKRSGEATSQLAADIMDVNQQSVEQYLRESGASLLIHGHTHRPGIHEFELNGAPVKRIVLEDWDNERASYLRVDGEGRQENISL
jgi:UDP-2,3-diacylglucosamine hydrolase